MKRFCFIVLALLICSNAFAAPPVATTIGGLQLGASGDSAVAVLGDPANISGDFALPQSVAPAGGVTYTLGDKGQVILLVGKISPMEARIVQITIEGQPGPETAKYAVDGFTIGANEADIIAKWGQPDKTIKREDSPIKTIAYNNSNVALSFNNSKLASISLVYRNSMMVTDLMKRDSLSQLDAQIAIGDMRVRGRQLELAREAFEEALKLDPSNSTVSLRLGGIYYSQNKIEQAQKAFAKVLEKEPANAVATYNLGRIAVKQNKPAEARKLLVKTTELDPQNAAAYNELGMLDETEKKLDAAEKNFSKAAELAPNASEPHQNLGRLALRKNNRNLAIDHYSQALILEEKSETPDRNVIEGLRQALAALRKETSPNSAGTTSGS